MHTHTIRQSGRQSGNVMILSLLLVSLLVMLTGAMVTTQQKNIQQADFFMTRSALHHLAESGLSMSIHDLQYNASGESGNLGTDGWDAAKDDHGADGKMYTYDKGEGDGIPTVGEPRVVPLNVGPPAVGALLIAHILPSGNPGVQRVVSTCTVGEDSVTVERLIRQNTVTFPRVGAILVDPDVALDLKGNSFMIDGSDTNPDGTPGSGTPLLGIATTEGATPGDNSAALLAQIPSKNYDQVVGLGSNPSVGEVPAGDVDMDALFAQFTSLHTQSLAPGTYTGLQIGDSASTDFPITYVDGDLHLSGNGSGAGVLVVDGSVTISGQFYFEGMIMVNGDIRLTGGGSGVQVYGGVVVRESFTAIDSELTISGQADLHYSSQVLDQVESALTNVVSYDSVYYQQH